VRCQGVMTPRSDGIRCSFCGSMSVAEVIETLQIEGSHFSGSDWKYGWPHKFYIGKKGQHGKFYAVHLFDATPEEWAQWREIVYPLIGIRFEIDEQGLKYGAPGHGHQAWGTLGADLKPIRATAGVAAFP
jgi:hypothetical protein